MWAIGRQDLGLTDAEFWRLTPREFDALSRRATLQRQREDYRFGVLAAITANVHRDAKLRHEPFTPADFFELRELLGDAPASSSQMTPEQIKAVAHAITAWAIEKQNGTKE